MQTPTEQINTNWIKMRDIIRFTEYMLSFSFFLSSGILPDSEYLHYELTLYLYKYFRSHIYSSCNELFDQKNLKNYFINNYKRILNRLNTCSDNFKNDLKQYHLDNLIDYNYDKDKDKIKEETTKEQKEKILELMFFYLWEKLEFFKINAEKFIKYLPHNDFFSRQIVTEINLHIENKAWLYIADLHRIITKNADETFNTTRIYSCYMTAMYFYPEYFTNQIAPDKDKIMFCLAMDSIFDEKQLNIIRPLININTESNEYKNLPKKVQNIIEQLESEKFRNNLIKYWESLENVDLDQAKIEKDGKTIMNTSVFSFNVHSENSNYIQDNLKANIQSEKNEYENYEFEKQIFVFNGQNKKLYEYIEDLKKNIRSLDLSELQNSGINIIDEITPETKKSFRNEFQQLHEEKYIPFEDWYDEHKIEKIRTITQGEIDNFLEKPIDFLQKFFEKNLKLSLIVDNDRKFFRSAIKISILNSYTKNNFPKLVLQNFSNDNYLTPEEQNEILKDLPAEVQISLITGHNCLNLFNKNNHYEYPMSVENFERCLLFGLFNKYFNNNNNHYKIFLETIKKYVSGICEKKDVNKLKIIFLKYNKDIENNSNYSINIPDNVQEELLNSLPLENQICIITNFKYSNYSDLGNGFIKKVCNNEFPNCQHPEILISATVKKLHEKYPEKKRNRIAFKIIFEDEKIEQENKKEFVQQYFSNPEEREKFVEDNSFIKKVSRGQFPFDKGTAMLILYKFYYLYKENPNKATRLKTKILNDPNTTAQFRAFLDTMDFMILIPMFCANAVYTNLIIYNIAASYYNYANLVLNQQNSQQLNSVQANNQLSL